MFPTAKMEKIKHNVLFFFSLFVSKCYDGFKEAADDNNNTLWTCVQISGNCGAITIIQAGLVRKQHSAHCSLISGNVSHDKLPTVSALSSQCVPRSPCPPGNFNSEQNNSGALKLFGLECGDCVGADTSPELYFSVRFWLLCVYTRCYFPVIFNLLQDSSHWTAFLFFPLVFPVM